MIKSKNWNPREDKLLKPKEFEIHQLYHEKLAEKIKTEKDVFEPRKARIKSLEILNNKISGIKGNILEIGAGDGWCSAYILKKWNNQIKSLDIMEISDSAIEKLIPKTLSVCSLSTEKISLIKGSFNNIPHQNHYDVIVAMGALHHSSNLAHTLQTIYESLKPGAWLIAQEPFVSDNTQNDFYTKRNNETVNFKGVMTVKNEERSDNFFRLCEYRSAAYAAGFIVHIERLFTYDSRKNIKRALIYKLFKKEKENQAHNGLFYFQKPLNKN